MLSGIGLRTTCWAVFLGLLAPVIGGHAALAAPTWHELHPQGSPPSPRASHSLVLDSTRNRLILFGGATDSGRLNDLWELTLGDTPAWAPLAAVGTPPSGRSDQLAVYDAAGDRMIIFGGISGGATNDLYELRFGGTPTWSPLSATGPAPPPRYNFSGYFDDTRREMRFYGGIGFTALSDTWSLKLTPPEGWTQLAPGGTAPGPRINHVYAQDTFNDRALLFGGNFPSPPNRLDVLPLAGPLTWIRLDPGGPSPPGGPSLMRLTANAYPGENAMILFGGRNQILGPVADTWKVTMTTPPRWELMTFVGATPAARELHTMVPDPARGRIILFGGATGSGSNKLNDLWELSLGSASAVTERHAARANALVAYPNPSTGRVFLRFPATLGASEVQIIDVRGRLVAALGVRAAGDRLEAVWDGFDSRGRIVRSGGYWATIPGTTSRTKVVIAAIH